MKNHRKEFVFKDSSKQTETASLEPDVVENWTEENIDDRATGNTDTVMQPIDFREFNEVLNVAPGDKCIQGHQFRVFGFSNNILWQN